MRVRPGDLAAMFEVYIIAVGLGALKTAFDSTGPWYAGPATFWAYFASFLGGVVLLGVLLLSAVFLIRTTPRGYSLPDSTSSAGSVGTTTSDPIDRGMEDLMHSLEGTAVRDTKQGTTTLLETPEVRVASTVAAPIDRIRAHRRSVIAALIGPTVASAGFTAVSAALLPASDTILQTNYATNTFAILLFAYGWGGLVAYVVASVLLATRAS